MEFALSEDQQMLQASTASYLEAACSLDTVRDAAGGDAKAAQAVSAGLYELGVGMTLVPEEYGGLGLGLLDAALVQEVLGRHVAPMAHTAGAMAIAGIASGGSKEQQADWLPNLATGDARFSVAIGERVSVREDAGVRAVNGNLSGKSLFVFDAPDATHVLAGDIDGQLHVVSADASGLSRRPLTTIDKTRVFSELVFADVEATVLGDQGETNKAADHVVATGRLLLAADTLGAAQAMLDKAVAYSLERKQFGRAIGGFQAVKHLCAEMAAEIEPARALVWHAAHAFDQNMAEAAMMICLATSHLAEVGTFVARAATEVYGGMGFTDLMGLHYWFKRIGVNRQLLGGPERVREDAARLQGWG